MACRTIRPKRDLLRVVRDPAGAVALDPVGTANGRGAYVCRDAACIDRAIRTGALARALRTPIPAALGAALATSAGIHMNETNTQHIEGGARGQE